MHVLYDLIKLYWAACLACFIEYYRSVVVTARNRICYAQIVYVGISVLAFNTVIGYIEHDRYDGSMMQVSTYCFLSSPQVAVVSLGMRP